MEINMLIIPLGILGYSCVFLAVLTGLLMFKFHVRRIKLKWHVWFGICALVLATVHAGIVIFYR